MRSIALDRGMTILKLNKMAETEKAIDLELDSRLKKLGKTKDNFVVDGRLAAFFIPNAEARIFLETDNRVRAERILKEQREHERSKTLKETIANIKKRENSEKKRYQKYYGVNYLDKKLYNCVLDTTKLTPEQCVDKILIFINRKNSG